MAPGEHKLMSSRSKGDQGEYEFTRAAYDELRDAERCYQVEFHLELEPTPQRGVWLLAVLVRAKGEDEGMAYVVKWSGAWPNSQVVSYGAFLYQATHRAVRMVEAWHAQREQDEAPRH